MYILTPIFFRFQYSELSWTPPPEQKTIEFLAYTSSWFYGFLRMLEYMFERKPMITKINNTKEVISRFV